ncbi:amino acid permease-associated region [Gemmatirosa kalamazoonensis]|uniref:Amino acid permease-associated region n=1 Tax=Gemmatirosa kalamazoonensis TaxID=861299 RepID=W0RQQ6_9BACT|nr:APC family permease [Gemmatirosa kalamazoonensis]AHG91888.1 amino acid permease-associated region [Gemmatirosa kalamazoonensis]
MSENEPPGALRRVLGVGFGVAVGIGSMIGAGILRAPADVAARLPTPALFLGVWVVGGLYALLGGNALSELGVAVPRSGGQYVYARRAFGPYIGFVVGWNDWLSSAGSVAAVAIALSESAAALLGAGARAVPVIAVLAVAVAYAVLSRGVRVGDRAQRATSAVKAVALLALVAACVFAARPHAAPAPNAHAGAAAFVLALQGVIYAYDGWTGPIYFSGELRDPGREVPRAVFGGVLSGMALYLAVNAAFLVVLSIDAMSRSTLVAADVARAIAGARGASLVHWLVLLALPSAVVANLLLASRVAYAMGRDGAAPRRLGDVSAAGVPGVGLAVSGVVAALFAATGAFERVIAVCAFLFVASYVVSFAAVFVLRRREPALPRAYRAWGHPWTTGLAVVASSVFLAGVVAADPRGAAVSVASVAVTLPLYALLRRARPVAG